MTKIKLLKNSISTTLYSITAILLVFPLLLGCTSSDENSYLNLDEGFLYGEWEVDGEIKGATNINVSFESMHNGSPQFISISYLIEEDGMHVKTYGLWMCDVIERNTLYIAKTDELPPFKTYKVKMPYFKNTKAVIEVEIEKEVYRINARKIK